jgi:2-succinyl-5-enolpyruvyl-6-hydroxy-3-cyclohexene-1-carboxylate synthase
VSGDAADAATAFARTVADEWARAGVRDAVLAPGSRSAPLALALAADVRFRLHVLLDERSAAFFALGLGRATGRAAVVLCTSGTAAANFHPAVLEAHHGDVPLLVCTADRPPELRGVGAAQTIDQVRLYGGAVRWFLDVAPPLDAPGAGRRWRELAARAVRETSTHRPGPVHLNLCFREPLVPTGAPLVDAPPVPTAATRPQHAGSGPAEPDPDDVRTVVELVRAHPRGLLVAGWGAGASAGVVARFSAVAGWPVLADPISDLRTDGAITTYDLLARDAAARRALEPELVLRVGAPLTGKPASQWLDGVPTVLVDPEPARRDPARACRQVVRADPAAVLAAAGSGPPAVVEPEWCARWRRVESAVRAAIDRFLDESDDPFEGRIARDVVTAAPPGTDLVVASSMPVRDVESFAPARSGLHFHSNRGVNGIDGFVSTVLGVAAGRQGTGTPTVALTGDLCFLHDGGGLFGVWGRELDVVFVVVDNDGGGIFSFLPQAELTEHFETLFGTPHHLDLAALAAAHGLPVTPVTTAAELAPALRAAVDAGGPRMLHVRTDRGRNVARHRDAFAAAASALTPSVLGSETFA